MATGISKLQLLIDLKNKLKVGLDSAKNQVSKATGDMQGKLNAFTASNITGTEKDGTGVTVGRAGTGVFGEIRSQALESSNVDLANELVRLMILQRSYSANSQSLKAVDQTLRDTLQMVG